MRVAALLPLALVAGCSALPFGRDVVVEKELLPCPMVELAAPCPAPPSVWPATCRAALLQNERLRAIVLCHQVNDEARLQARAECVR